MTFDELFGDQRLLVILRGRPPAETVALANRAWDVGVRHVEVPIGQPEQVAALAATVEAAADRGRVVGAGTVVTVEQVRAAVGVGARYTVAPGFDRSIHAASLSAGLPHLPGVGTATEVQRARGAGCGWVKAFPAESLGLAWFSAVSGPFSDISYVATGGVTVATAPRFLAAGARMVALGSALSDPAQLAQLPALVEAARVTLPG